MSFTRILNEGDSGNETIKKREGRCGSSIIRRGTSFKPNDTHTRSTVVRTRNVVGTRILSEHKQMHGSQQIGIEDYKTGRVLATV
jgi:hypothetical protein